MDTLALSILLSALNRPGDLVSPQPGDWAVVNKPRRVWWRIGRSVKTEGLDRPEPREAYSGWFILGYGKVSG